MNVFVCDPSGTGGSGQDLSPLVVIVLEFMAGCVPRLVCASECILKRGQRCTSVCEDEL